MSEKGAPTTSLAPKPFVFPSKTRRSTAEAHQGGLFCQDFVASVPPGDDSAVRPDSDSPVEVTSSEPPRGGG